MKIKVATISYPSQWTGNYNGAEGVVVLEIDRFVRLHDGQSGYPCETKMVDLEAAKQMVEGYTLSPFQLEFCPDSSRNFLKMGRQIVGLE